MTLVLDAGAFLALERRRGDVAEMLAIERRLGATPRTHAGIVGQVWRGGPRQATAARLLARMEVHPLDRRLGQRAGELLQRSGTADVIDAALVLLAEDGDRVMTSDPDDISRLAAAASRSIRIVPV